MIYSQIVTWTAFAILAMFFLYSVYCWIVHRLFEKGVLVLLIKSMTMYSFRFLPVFKRHAPDAVIVDEI